MATFEPEEYFRGPFGPAGTATTCRPQAGMAVYGRGPDGLLAAARAYDHAEAPFGHPRSGERH